MNTEQHAQQAAAAAAIEAGVHDIARIEVLINRGLDIAARSATEVVGIKFAEEIGVVMTDKTATNIAGAMRAELAPAFDAIIKKVGAETLSRSADSAFVSLGRSLGERHMTAWGHKIVDMGRMHHQKQAAAEYATRVPEPLPVTHSNPVALQNNPNPVPLSSGADILKNIEAIEQRGRSYPAKKARR